MVQPEGQTGESSSINTRRRNIMEMSVGEASSTYPGFRFSPTDEELIQCYLKKKLQTSGEGVDIISEVDICKHEPWDLPAESIIASDREWYFFTARDRKYPTGSQNKRATAMGYWKATGKERSVKLNGNIIGTKRTLVFHMGRAPRGQRTEWIMHEFCTIEKNEKGIVVCRIRRNEEFHLNDNTGRDSRDESAISTNTTQLSGGEQSQMEGIQSAISTNTTQLSGGEQSQMEGIQLGEQSQVEGIQLSGGEPSQMEGIELSAQMEAIQLPSGKQYQREGIQLSGGEQSQMGGIHLESSPIRCDSSNNSHSTEQLISKELPDSGGSDEKIAALEEPASEESDEKIAALEETISEESDEKNAASGEFASEESDKRIAEFFHGSSSLTKTNIEEDEDDCYTDIMKDDIIKLDDENFGDTLQSEIKRTTSDKEMPSQGTAHRRIRLRKRTSFRRKPSKLQNEVIAPKYQRSFIAKIKYPSIFMFSLILLVVVWVVGWNGFQVLGYDA